MDELEQVVADARARAEAFTRTLERPMKRPDRDRETQLDLDMWEAIGHVRKLADIVHALAEVVRAGKTACWKSDGKYFWRGTPGDSFPRALDKLEKR